MKATTDTNRRAILRAAIALAGAFGLAACAAQVPHTTPDNPTGRPLVFPITAEQADRVIAQSMSEIFPGTPASAVVLPHRGYTLTMRILIDTHQINAYAVPAPGGFSFHVDHNGTIPLTGGARAKDLFAAIIRHARALAAPLPPG